MPFDGKPSALNGTEEAIVIALTAAETMTGVDGNTVYALPLDRLRDALKNSVGSNRSAGL